MAIALSFPADIYTLKVNNTVNFKNIHLAVMVQLLALNMQLSAGLSGLNFWKIKVARVVNLKLVFTD